MLSFQPPVGVPQVEPVRSPLIAAAGGKLVLALDEADAIAPFAADATFFEGGVVPLDLPARSHVAREGLRGPERKEGD